MVQQRSFKLLKTDRNAIKRAALSFRFAKDQKRLKNTEKELAIQCYKAAFPEVIRRAAMKLPEKWVNFSDTFTLNVGGRHTYFHAAKKVPVPHQSYGVIGEGISDPKLVEAVETWQQAAKKSEEDYNTTEMNLGALLEKCGTVRTLREMWPQGERFWKDIDFEGREIGGLPAVAMENLNKALGLPA